MYHLLFFFMNQIIKTITKIMTMGKKITKAGKTPQKVVFTWYGSLILVLEYVKPSNDKLDNLSIFVNK